MKKEYKKTLLVYVMLLSVVAMLPLSVSAVPPTIGEISLDPEPPVVQSSVTFTVDVTATQIFGVFVIVQECNENTGICYTPQNMSMTEITQGTYQTTVLLTHQDATYIEYSVNVHSDNGWDNTSGIKRTLAESSNGTGNSNDESPGFEMIIVLAAFSIVGIILLRKKR